MRKTAIVCGLLTALILVGSFNSLPAGEKQTGFHWVEKEEGMLDLYYGEQPALRYMYAFDDSTKERQHDTYKVYHHVFGPGSDTIITKGPGGQYTHHRGLYVGWNKTSANGKSYDFWHCTNGAHLRHAKILKQSADENQASMTTEIHWNDAEGKPVIIEQRTVEVRRIEVDQKPGYGWQIDWTTTLNSQRGKIELTGDRQHAGFQFRAAQEVAENNSARYIRPEGFPQQKDAVQVGDQGDPPKHIDLNWFAMTFPVKEQPYTVEYFEHPSMPDPSLYSERPYGRFGAFFKASLDEEHPLEMQYRVIVTAGEPPTQGAIQKRYDQFVEESK